MNDVKLEMAASWLLLLLCGAMLLPSLAGAEALGREQNGAETPAADWGGHLKIRGQISREEADSLLGPGALYDGSLDTRLTSELALDERASLETHYELIVSGGDSRRREQGLALVPRELLAAGYFTGRVVEDDRRFFDLTQVLDEGDKAIAYHRLDRLALTLTPEWGTVRIGRQAVTLGNGLLFNPMDLFNAFAPTDIERDYKLGDDLLSLQMPVPARGDLQLLLVPRRDPATGDPAWDQTSLAGRFHWAPGVTEFDLLLARHFQDAVFGLGSVGYLGEAAWRLDATWTRFRAEERSSFLSLVANLDYAWVWWGKNLYGFVEFFYSGLGNGGGDYPAALADPALAARLERGELFTVGRTYLAGHVQLELHPLVNLSLTAVNNLQDPSGVLQPRLTWDVRQDVQLLLGGTLLYGGQGSEFGGFLIPGTGFTTRSPDSMFLWVSWYF